MKFIRIAFCSFPIGKELFFSRFTAGGSLVILVPENERKGGLPMYTSFDPLAQRYPSQRLPLYAAKGMVNCSSPQAAAARLEALRRGGNALY